MQDGFFELFDYSKDPYEMTNIAGTTNPGVIDQLHTQLAAAASCVGTTKCEAILAYRKTIFS